MSRSNNPYRSRYSGPDPDEDADYQLALKLSAEMNAEMSAPSTYQSPYNDDAEFALAMQLAYDKEITTMDQNDFAPSSASVDPWGPSTAPLSGSSAWGMGEPAIVEYHAETPSKNIPQQFYDFIGYVKSGFCSCGEQLLRSELDVNLMFQNWLHGKGPLSSWIKCRRCSKSTCFGCTPTAYVRQSRLGVQGKQVSWCCAGGRLFLIWVLLCGFDQHFCAERSKEATKATSGTQNQPRMNWKAKTNNKPRGGVGFGGDHRRPTSYMPSGMGYGSDMNDYEEMGDYTHSNSFVFQGKGQTLNPYARPTENGKYKAQSAQQVGDGFNMTILTLMKGLLPSLERETNFDSNPPEAVTEMLVHSKILNYCAELLRNDSLDDATKRKELYHALFDFIQALGMHVMAGRTLFEKRPAQPDSVNLLTLSFSNVQSSSKEMFSSLTENLRNFNTQSVMILQNAKSNEKDFRTEDGQNMLLLCRQISDVCRYIFTYVENSSHPSNVPATDLAIIEMPDEEIFATHTYAAVAKALSHSPPGRIKRLITEITTLKTGLPPGVYVRYCENRLDVLKMVIVGPRDTPYENGLFEFDFFCDSGYPNKPPMVAFKGTGGGRVSINPNLYADGKICLSLLGTWQGEPWKPGESTLLQVVVSIQAMIFCEEPWYNEPGREATYNRGIANNPALTYNQKIREHTVRYATLAWLDKPPALWQPVIQHHFKANANQILQTANEWSKTKVPQQTGRHRYDGLDDFDYEMPGVRSRLGTGLEKGDIASMLSRLQNAMQRYGATYVVKHVQQPATQAPSPMPPPAMSPYMPPNPMLPGPPLGPPPLYDFSQPPPPPQPVNPNTHNRGGFWGLGRMLGHGENHPSGNSASAANTAPHHRGSLFSPQHRDRRGRYETRSTTRGRGGLSRLTANAGGPFSNAPPNPFFGDHRDRGGPTARGGRGSHSYDHGSRGRGFF